MSQFNTPHLSSADLEAARRVILYRSRQRGWLELDVILGSFAEKHLANFSSDEVAQFESILATENPDLYKFVSGQLPPNDDLKNNNVFKKLLQHVNADHQSL